MSDMVERCNEYLSSGGLFNPELMDHDAVRDLVRDCRDELAKLQRYRDLVWFIANDYHELSYEKIQWQRDDWQKRCTKLRNELESDDIGFTPEELNHRLNDDF